MFSRSCAMHTIARNACKIEYTVYVISKHICINIKFHQSGRIISSRLKYSRNALYINVLSFARYFRQRFAPFIRHRRRSQGYPYEFVTFTKFVLTYNLYDYLRANTVRPYKSVTTKLHYLSAKNSLPALSVARIALMNASSVGLHGTYFHSTTLAAL